MLDFQMFWDEASCNLPQWASRILRPKFRLWALCNELFDAPVGRQEFARLASRLRQSLAFLGDIPETPDAGLRDCSLSMNDPNLAAFYHQEFHYLASPRRDGIHLGLGNGAYPICLLTFSPFDLDHLLPILPVGVVAEEVLVLSRQVTIGQVPRNTWSYTFGRACQWLRVNCPNVRIIVTYLDVNLDFCGSSYLATNWLTLGNESKGRYVFVDGVPLTNRDLVHRFGTARFDDLSALLGQRVARTMRPLCPLTVYGFCLNRRDRRRVTVATSCDSSVRS